MIKFFESFFFHSVSFLFPKVLRTKRLFLSDKLGQPALKFTDVSSVLNTTVGTGNSGPLDSAMDMFEAAI